MAGRAWFVRSALLTALLAASVAAQAAQGPVEPDEAWRRVLAEDRYDTTSPDDVPGREVAGHVKEGVSVGGPGPNERRGPSNSTDAGAPAANRSVAPYVFAAVVVVLLVLVLRAARHRRAAPSVGAPTPRTKVLATAVAPVALPDADALAAAGRFDEALAALLRRALIEANGGREWPMAWTARTAAAAAPLSGSLRKGLFALVGSVEGVRYAGRPADRAAWDAARAESEALRRGLEG